MEEIKYPELVGEMAKHRDTQKTIGNLLGITYSSVCRRLYGKSEFTKSEIDKLCEYYGKDYYELFKEKNDEKKEV